ncbi:MAG: hypothetical protein JSR97_11785 [Verrucomicrobia bacterium]|nr:hypothetical protein [Verrucomicrobiota bacterium]
MPTVPKNTTATDPTTRVIRSVLLDFEEGMDGFGLQGERRSCKAKHSFYR